jgi:seryl-tRNA synthetase
MSKPEDALNLEALDGFRWLDNGQSSLSGNLLELFRQSDQLFLSWAAECDASEYRFPTFISARDLAQLDYFRSFPHLVTFPVVLKSDEQNLKRFSEGSTLNAEGEVTLTDIEGVRDVLTPAACYHFYVHFRGDELQSAKYVTTRANCFRREEYYSPLQRQWSFSMREIVCIGTADEVKEFLNRYQDRCERFFERIGLPVEFQNATDPFFNPSKNPKYILQKLDPVKTEMVYQSGLAIGSINFHRNYFGEAFQISRDGKEAFSGCVAFGLERWIYAVLHHFGFDHSKWPRLDSATEE